MGEAFGFLSVLGGAAPLTRRALPWFPVVGLMLGAAVGAGWDLGQRVLPWSVAAGLTLVLGAGLTGLLHLDGLADAADGLLPPVAPARRLEIMRTPEVGAFGVAVVVLVLLVQFAALSSTGAEPLVLAGLWAASRAIAAGAVAIVPYARTEGAAAGLVEGAPRWPVVAVLPAMALAGLGAGWVGAVAVASGAVAAAVVVALARSRIGGFTGDVLGAAIVIGETVGLVVCGARW